MNKDKKNVDYKTMRQFDILFIIIVVLLLLLLMVGFVFIFNPDLFNQIKANLYNLFN